LSSLWVFPFYENSQGGGLIHFPFFAMTLITPFKRNWPARPTGPAHKY
jgi:hypothetical protein